MTWPMVALGEVMALDLDPHPVEAGSSYPNIGIYSFGRGTFVKPAIEAASTSASTLYRIRTGQIIYSRLFAFEGAYAAVPAEHDGMFVSNEFPTFTVDACRADPRYVGWLFRWQETWRALRLGAVGMGDRRQRVHPDRILAFRVALPPISVQRSIVDRLEAALKATDRLSDLQNGIRKDLAALIVRANETLQAGPVSLSEALLLDENRVSLVPDISYTQVGIRGFGGGLFRKGGVTAAETTYRHFNRLHAGQFVVSQVKGWEGAVAVCDDDHAGLFASPEYRTFRCDPSVLRPTYFAYLCRTSWFHAKLAPATRGQGARRERLRPEMLMALSIPLPPVDIQARLERIFARIDAASTASSAEDIEHLLPAMLHQAFGDSARTV